MQTNGTFNPRLIITDHFDNIKNELDVKVEAIFDQNRQLSDKERDEINAIREKQINMIKKIEDSNISEWPYNFEKERYYLELADLLNDTALSDEQKIERIKESIIKSDAFLMDDPKLVTKMSLWEMPFFVNKVDLEFSR